MNLTPVASTLLIALLLSRPQIDRRIFTSLSFMPSDARSRSPPPPPPRDTAPPNPRLPGFPRWRGPMSTAINMASRPSFPPAPPSIPPSQISMFSQPTPMMFNPYIPTMPQSQLPPSQPMAIQPTPMTPAPSTPCSPTQPCPATPSQQSNSPASAGCTPQPRRNIQASPAGSTREYGFDLNEHWQQDAEFYDNQKINGLTFPRSIRSSAFTTKLDIEGCDPLKLPVAALMYQQHNNLWLRKLAWGRELYLVPVGDLAGVVFTTELLSQLRSRGIDIDRVCQNKARQEGKTLDKTGNTKFAAQLIAEHIQNWLPTRGTDPESHHKITALQEEVAKLRQQLGSTDEPSSSAPASSAPAATPLQSAFMRGSGQTPPPGFEPASLLAMPGSENSWLVNNRPSSLAKTRIDAWIKSLDISPSQRSTLTTNLEKVFAWWNGQGDEAIQQVQKVAVMTGVPATMIGANVNMDSILKVLTAALTMTT